VHILNTNVIFFAIQRIYFYFNIFIILNKESEAWARADDGGERPQASIDEWRRNDSGARQPVRRQRGGPL
jgi:hypothetical protein